MSQAGIESGTGIFEAPYSKFTLQPGSIACSAGRGKLDSSVPIPPV